MEELEASGRAAAEEYYDEQRERQAQEDFNRELRTGLVEFSEAFQREWETINSRHGHAVAAQREEDRKAESAEMDFNLACSDAKRHFSRLLGALAAEPAAPELGGPPVPAEARRHWNQVASGASELKKHVLLSQPMKTALSVRLPSSPNPIATLRLEQVLREQRLTDYNAPWARDGCVLRALAFACLVPLGYWCEVGIMNTTASAAQFSPDLGAIGLLQLGLALPMVLLLLRRLIIVRITHGERARRRIERIGQSTRQAIASFRAAFASEDGGLEGWILKALAPESLTPQLATEEAKQCLQSLVTAEQNVKSAQERRGAAHAARHAVAEETKPLRDQFSFMHSELRRVGQQILRGVRAPGRQIALASCRACGGPVTSETHLCPYCGGHCASSSGAE
jgi:hypothetical protein